MEFKNTLEIVTKDIQDIEKLVSNFKNYSSIPNIELDLALSRLRNVYDLLLLIKADRSESQLAPVAENNTQIKQVPKPEVPEKKHDPVVSAEITEMNYKPAKPVAESPQEIKASQPVVEKPAAAKKIAAEGSYINEKLGGQTNKKDVSAKLQGQAIKSIAGSLGINDKFYYIRELFAGNAETFRQTMEELDNAHNFNDAFSILTNNFQWDMESEAVQMLLNLVRRKFITSGNE